MSYIVDSSVTFTPSHQQIFIEVSIFADFFLSVRGWIMSAPPAPPPQNSACLRFSAVFLCEAPAIQYTVYCGKNTEYGKRNTQQPAANEKEL